MSTPERVACPCLFQSFDVEAAAEYPSDGADRSHDEVLPNDHRCTCRNLIHCTCYCSTLGKQFHCYRTSTVVTTVVSPYSYNSRNARSPVVTKVAMKKPLFSRVTMPGPLLLPQPQCQSLCCHQSRDAHSSIS